jgi:tetratricopeptide (TPR) repeat protein
MYEDWNHYSESFGCYNKAIKKDSNLYEAFYERGLLYKKMGKLHEAFDDYTRSLKILPTAPAYNNRGNIFMEFKMYKKALFDFQEALKLDISDKFYIEQVERAKQALIE